MTKFDILYSMVETMILQLFALQWEDSMDIWCTFQSQTEYSSVGAKVFAEFGGNNYTILIPIMDHNPKKSSKKMDHANCPPSSAGSFKRAWLVSKAIQYGIENFCQQKANSHQFFAYFLGFIQHRPKVLYKLLSFARDEFRRACESMSGTRNRTFAAN